MGGVLTATLWQNNRLSFDKVIFDGSPLVSYNSFMKVFMKKFYVDLIGQHFDRDMELDDNGKKKNDEYNVDKFI